MNTEDSSLMEGRIQDMFREMGHAPREMMPSKFWEEHNRKHLAELAVNGYPSFKRTLARSYFTWIVCPFDAQVRYLRSQLPFMTVIRAALCTAAGGRHPPINWRDSMYYSFLTRLLWEYAAGIDAHGLLDKLDEPLEGNPPRVYRRGRLISQDLANSWLEYRSVLAPEVNPGEIQTILELGPGYGRTAAVFLSLMPEARYILADIPPALAVSERYLSSVFRGRRIFRFRPFAAYEKVKHEFEASQIAFLLPHQLELLPQKSVDLFVNVSSFHEMRLDQIRYYFALLDRLVRKYFYLKQRREGFIHLENVTIREADYPIPGSWKRLFWRTCAVQEYFFEALFTVADSDVSQSALV